MDIPSSQKRFFTETLMLWHRHENFRTLPWKKEADPYKIWLAEIIMQQTRVEQGTPYYKKFIHLYPTITKLANANDEDVFRLWQGLGYYNRCKNLLYTARLIAHDLKGKFPDSYEEILKLKGVGNYTAAAIASFAYHQPFAVLDGNVLRVLARFFGIETPVDTTTGKKLFQSLAQELIDTKEPGAYNQSIMDFGATVCKPQLPLCTSCPLQKKCIAIKINIVQLLPVKSKKLIIKKRFFNYFIFLHQNKIWIQKREAKDIWQNLHEPYLIETEKHISIKKANEILTKSGLKIYQLDTDWVSSQKLSHQIIEAQFFNVIVQEFNPNAFSNKGKWIAINNLSKIAFPKTVVSFFEKKGYF